MFILNFIYDLLLLMTVDVTLKRHSKLRRLIFSAILGALSLAILFLPCGELILFIFKIITSVFMVLIAFGYRNIKYFGTNMIYLYMCSVILGGFLYFLNVEFSYKREGMVFYFDGMSVNYILLLIVAPIILFLYVREHKKFKSTYNYNYKVSIVFKNGKCLECNGFLDTGNRLIDNQKPIVIINQKTFEKLCNIKLSYILLYKDLSRINNAHYIKYNTISGQDKLLVFSVDEFIVENKSTIGSENILIGVSIKPFGKEYDAILNAEVLC